MGFSIGLNAAEIGCKCQNSFQVLFGRLQIADDRNFELLAI